MRTLAFTVPKRGRRELGQVCQDSAVAVVANDGRVVLAVADGVGSAPRSELGALAATATIAKHLVQATSAEPGHVVAAFRTGRDAWLAYMDQAEIPGSARKVTFAFAVIDPARGRICAGAIGDCFVFVTRTGEGARTVLLDHGRGAGAFANELDATLADETWSTQIRLVPVLDPSVNAIMLSSDGLEPVVIRDGPVHGGTRIGTVGLHESFSDWLLAKVREGSTPADIAAALEEWDELMAATSDDLGAAIAVW